MTQHSADVRLNLHQTNWLRWLPVVLIFLLILLAVGNRFIQDDAFISFRYARHLALGQGLVWNPGEHVEGYSNFLWTLLVALPLSAGWDPVTFTWMVGWCCFALTLWGTLRLGRILLSSELWTWIAIVLLGTNYSFSCYATGGLETQLQTALVVWMVVYYERLARATVLRLRDLSVWSVLAGLALLVRLDSALPLALIGSALIARLFRRRDVSRWRALTALAVPCVLLIVPYLIWKLWYYGELLPNSYYVKVGTETSLGQGAFFLWLFLRSYWLAPYLLWSLVRVRRLGDSAGSAILLWGLLVGWVAYVAYVGGGFMEFRLLVPILPVTFLLVCRALSRTGPLWLGLLFAAAVPVGSWVHARTFQGTREIESIGRLQNHVSAPSENWSGIGKRLHEFFGGAADPPLIATTAAGAIPFYSELPCLDMLGINDRWVARNGLVLGSHPGHQRLTTHSYMQEQTVHLVIGHPIMRHTGTVIRAIYRPEDLAPFGLVQPEPQIIPANARVVDIPIGEGYQLTALYLNPHPVIDRVIAQERLRTYPVISASK